MAVASQGLHTSKTYLYTGTSLGSMTKSIPIKNVPALGSAPAQIEITDLSAEKYKSYIEGLQDIPQLEFLANYTPENYDTIEKMSDGSVRYWQVRIGEDNKGIWTFKGAVSPWKTETAVDSAHEFSFAITLQGGIKFTKTATEANSFETYSAIEMESTDGGN